MQRIFSIVLLLLFSASGCAWGRKGHTRLAQVAFGYLDEAAKKNVLGYLDGMSLEEAANWMDDIKGDRSKDFMKPCHCANFPKGAKPACREGSNIVQILNSTILEPSAKDMLDSEEIKTKLLFLFHMVGGPAPAPPCRL